MLGALVFIFELRFPIVLMLCLEQIRLHDVQTAFDMP